MVQTRRQYNRWVQNRGDNYESSQSECSDCSQRSEMSDNGYEHAQSHDDGPPELQHRNGAQYRSNDHCKRHRKRDNDPYTEAVTT